MLFMYAHVTTDRYNARILDVVNAPQTNGSVINGDSEKPDTNGTAKLSHYRAQLIDQDLEGIEDCIHTVTSNDLK
jgi:hypothetical protein